MNSKTIKPRQRSLWKRLKRFVLQRPWVINVAFWIVRIIMEKLK